MLVQNYRRLQHCLIEQRKSEESTINGTQKNPKHSSGQPQPGGKDSKNHSTLVVILFTMIITVFSLWGCGKGPEGNEKDTAPVSLPFSIAGTWKGELTETYPARGDMPAYEAAYNARVVVGQDMRIEEMQWTDSHTSLSRSTISLEGGNAGFAIEEREGGNPEKMAEPMKEVMKVLRRGRAVSLTYNRPRMMDIELSIPDVFPSDDKIPRFQSKEGAITAAFPLSIVPAGSWSVSPDRVNRLIVVATWFRGTYDKNNIKDDYLQNVKTEETCVGYNSWAFQMALNNVSHRRTPPDRSLSDSQESLVRLESNSTVNLRAPIQYQRQVALRFEENGQATLEIKDQRLQPSGQPLVYHLRRSE